MAGKVGHLVEKIAMFQALRSIFIVSTHLTATLAASVIDTLERKRLCHLTDHSIL
ncbi:hypothetical protein IQ22_02279 [Pseudomonas duriflava]|uniref:Uncharacterized protein n=1 Tax=Pseudomonas duriflava TaxID=459528 RepID=A0A562QAE1_9PSED|nr:hypothetical protein IQ22_02279 [Pseudomonas duriflava]